MTISLRGVSLKSKARTLATRALGAILAGAGMAVIAMATAAPAFAQSSEISLTEALAVQPTSVRQDGSAIQGIGTDIVNPPQAVLNGSTVRYVIALTNTGPDVYDANGAGNELVVDFTYPANSSVSVAASDTLISESFDTVP